jgi:hypothetical protein
LESRDDAARTYSYTILNPGPLPVANCHSTIAVDLAGSGSSTVWSGKFERQRRERRQCQEIDGIYKGGPEAFANLAKQSARCVQPAALGQERVEVASTVVPGDNRLAVDPRLSAGGPRTASAIAGNRSVKSAPRRVQTCTRSPCLRATIRKPSCFISYSQPGMVVLQRASRTPDILPDAANMIFLKDPKTFTGNFLIDDTFLFENGVRDFDCYRVDPTVDLTPWRSASLCR